MKFYNDIKTVAKNGQICLGKELAGQVVQITKNPDHTITIIPVIIVPTNEKWLIADNGLQRLDKSLKWMESTGRRTDNAEEIINQFGQLDDE